jgi:hypothetical protein
MNEKREAYGTPLSPVIDGHNDEPSFAFLGAKGK